FDHVHVDLRCPLPANNGYTYVLPGIDRFMCWPKAVPLKVIAASTIANKLIKHWVLNFIVFFVITTDKGAQFKSRLFQQLTEML
ncbi:pol poly, partial [Schistosoma japonicum]